MKFNKKIKMLKTKKKSLKNYQANKLISKEIETGRYKYFNKI